VGHSLFGCTGEMLIHITKGCWLLSSTVQWFLKSAIGIYLPQKVVKIYRMRWFLQVFYLGDSKSRK